VFDQRGELPLLPFGNPIGFVPASRGGVYIESKGVNEMRLTLARHPVTEIRFGKSTRLEGSLLVVDQEELRRLILGDECLQSVGLETVRPGESCRAGPVFDIIEPRAKEPGSGPDFPGILGPPLTAGMGTTHVLEGTAVTVLGEKSPEGSRGPVGNVLEMGGVAAEGSSYSLLQHLVVVPHDRPGLAMHAAQKGKGICLIDFSNEVGPALF